MMIIINSEIKMALKVQQSIKQSTGKDGNIINSVLGM